MKDHSGATVPIWRDVGGAPSAARLTADIETDVCVIGAGISGVTTAYLLAKEGRNVVLLDSDAPGNGQTARTSAHLSSAFDDRIYEIARIHGKDGARLAVESHAAAIDLIEQLNQTECLDADFQRVDGYLFAPAGSGEVLTRELVAAQDAGLWGVELLERLPIGFDSGPALRFPRQARFHPRKYVNGLARVFQEASGRLFEDAFVTDVAEGDRITVSTRSGPVVHADSVVIATNTPFTNRLVLHTKMHPYLSYVIGLRVVPGSVPDALYWDTEDPYHYVRLQRRGDEEFLLVGGEDHWVGAEHDDADRYERLQIWAEARFPTVGPPAFTWSGQILETVDGLGFIGRNPTHGDNVYVITGDSGMGLTHGTLGAMIVRDLIEGRDNPWAALYDPSRKPLRTTGVYLRDNLRMASKYGDWFRGGDVQTSDDVQPGHGAVVARGLKKFAVYRSEDGTLFECSAVCPHLGGLVRWNDAEKTFDCPVHGSRFSAQGEVIQGPASKGLEVRFEPDSEVPDVPLATNAGPLKVAPV